MSLLIITQKVDRNDDVLGFFHTWLESFAKHWDEITVICLERGEYKLPSNVKVLSLGKEEGKSKIKYVLNFYSYIWTERKNYKYVFVHMNAIYILLGFIFWKLNKKKSFLWYNHAFGGFVAKIAKSLVGKIFYTSNHSFMAGPDKSIQMPAGIDTNLFIKNSNISNNKEEILYIGRISPVKKVGFIMETVEKLNKEDYGVKMRVVGSPAGDKDEFYLNKIKKRFWSIISEKKIIFAGSVPNFKIPFIYNEVAVCINATDSGSFDKTILEAMSCETLILVSNKSLVGKIPKDFIFKEGDIASLLNGIKFVMELSRDEKEKYAKSFREFVVKEHSLDLLGDKLKIEITG